MTGPQDPAAAGGDRLRAGHADREQVIEALKNAFVQGRLTKDELDTRAGQALAARTDAELAALTADIPPAPARAAPARPTAPVRPTAPARRLPLARAAAGSGGCLAIAFAAMQLHRLADPGNTPGTLPGVLGAPELPGGPYCRIRGTVHRDRRGGNRGGATTLPQATAAPAGGGWPRP